MTQIAERKKDVPERKAEKAVRLSVERYLRTHASPVRVFFVGSIRAFSLLLRARWSKPTQCSVLWFISRIVNNRLFRYGRIGCSPGVPTSITALQESIH